MIRYDPFNILDGRLAQKQHNLRSDGTKNVILHDTLLTWASED